MAISKRAMVGGAFYKGYILPVDATPGDYLLDMELSSKACAVNSIAVVCDEYGAGDYFKLEHLDATNVVCALIADSIYNIGAHVSKMFDFPSLELLDMGHKLRLTYTNVAGEALNVYVDLERITTKEGGA